MTETIDKKLREVLGKCVYGSCKTMTEADWKYYDQAKDKQIDQAITAIKSLIEEEYVSKYYDDTATLDKVLRRLKVSVTQACRRIGNYEPIAGDELVFNLESDPIKEEEKWIKDNFITKEEANKEGYRKAKESLYGETFSLDEWQIERVVKNLATAFNIKVGEG